MESNNINQEYFEGAAPLGEPHFDEEATVLSARPVVPLQEIKAEEQSRKRLIVGLAMACSLTMGALAATLIYKQRGEGQSTAISTAVPGAAGTVVDPASSPATAGVGGGAVADTLPEGGATTAEKKSVPSVSSSIASTAVELQRKKNLPEQAEELEVTRAERIDSRRLRRRLERQAWRESGARQRKTSDDLLRIRDIFEGPTRP